MAPLAMESSQINIFLIYFEIERSKNLASNHLIMVVKKIFVRRRAFPAQERSLIINLHLDFCQILILDIISKHKIQFFV